MYGARKGLSVALLLVLVSLLSAQITLHTAHALLADSTAAKRAVRSSGFYRQTEEALITSLASGLEGGDASVPVGAETAREIVRTVLPPGRLEAMGDATVDGLRTWLLGRTVRPEIIIDLSDIRRALPGALRSAVEAQVAQLPVCTPQQAAQLVRNTGGSIPPCRSADPKVNQALIDRALQPAAIEALIPARIDVAAQIEAANGPGFWDEANLALRNVRFALGLVPWGWVAVCSLLLLLWLLNRDRWYSPLGWAGVALVLGGGLPLLAGWGILQWIVPGMAPSRMGNPAETGLAAMAQALLTAMATSLRNLSLMVLLMGLTFVAVALYGAIRGERSERPGAPA
jgi:hypothetical protein